MQQEYAGEENFGAALHYEAPFVDACNMWLPSARPLDIIKGQSILIRLPIAVFFLTNWTPEVTEIRVRSLKKFCQLYMSRKNGGDILSDQIKKVLRACVYPVKGIAATKSALRRKRCPDSSEEYSQTQVDACQRCYAYWA
jgi:hypothetical protein